MIEKVKGVVGECCCEVSAVDDGIDALRAILSPLTSRYSYFRYFHVDYLKPCTYWPEESDGDDALEECSLNLDGSPSPACGICECSDDEVPELIRIETLRAVNNSNDSSLSSSSLVELSPCGCVDRTLSSGFEGFDDAGKDQWLAPVSQSATAAFVDLARNPERFTGYGSAGDGEKRQHRARSIWMEIYALCPPGDQCYEESVFHRLMSGLHGSTTAHICASAGDGGAPHLKMWQWRMGRRPDLVRNIYFALVFTLRAIDKLEPYYRSHRNGMFAAGIADEDAEVRALVDRLYEESALLGSRCSLFDEQSMFATDNDESSGNATTALRDVLRAKFQQISAILDCVDCETCKVHARLQILGIGTALKILLTDNLDAAFHTLQRNELLALFQTAHKFADSIDIAQRMRTLELEQIRAPQFMLFALMLFVLLVSIKMLIFN